jgi:hypothetical protein
MRRSQTNTVKRPNEHIQAWQGVRESTGYLDAADSSKAAIYFGECGAQCGIAWLVCSHANKCHQIDDRETEMRVDCFVRLMRSLRDVSEDKAIVGNEMLPKATCQPSRGVLGESQRGLRMV